jgi:hypothetical protein
VTALLAVAALAGVISCGVLGIFLAGKLAGSIRPSIGGIVDDDTDIPPR